MSPGGRRTRGGRDHEEVETIGQATLLRSLAMREGRGAEQTSLAVQWLRLCAPSAGGVG